MQPYGLPGVRVTASDDPLTNPEPGAAVQNCFAAKGSRAGLKAQNDQASR